MLRILLALNIFAVFYTAMFYPPIGRAETGEETYRLYCVQCHGTLGTGVGINRTSGGLSVSPIDHTSAKLMAKRSDKRLRLVIRKGGDAVSKSELMPPFGQTLTENQIEALVRYLRHLCKCKEGGQS